MMLGRGAAPLALGTLAVVTGAAFLWDVGALPGMASRNIFAYLFGLALGWACHRAVGLRHGPWALYITASTVLALVLIAGVELDGVRRWLPLGPLRLQPALILSPLLLLLVASQESRHWRAAIILPLTLIAMQPDAASSIALAAGVAVLMAGASRRSRRGWSRRRIIIAAGALGLAVSGLIVAGIRTPPPVAFVEGTIGIAALSGLSAAVLHLLASTLMLAAPLSRHEDAGTALATYFALSAVAAMFWAFPMPVVGAGPSHLIGFGLAIGWLATQGSAASHSRATAT